jgi:mycoredoxin
MNGAGTVVRFGTDWCGHTQRVRRFLEGAGVPYRYVNLEADPRAVARLSWLTGGSASHPTPVIGDEVLVEPSLPELADALQRAA